MVYELKLLDDFTILDSFELNYRLNLCKDLASILKKEMQDIILMTYGLNPEDYNFDKEYKNAFEEFDSPFKLPAAEFTHDYGFDYKKYTINYEIVKDKIEEIQLEIGKR